MKYGKGILMGCGMVMELSGIVIIAKRMGKDSSPAAGIILLVLGIIVFIIGMAVKKKDNQESPK